MTTRQNILENIRTVLEDIPEIKTVLVNKLSVPDFGIYTTPVVFVFSGEEAKRWDVINYESWIWPVYIEVYAIDEDMETLLGLIHNAMAVDETRGGYALKAERVSCSAPMLVEADNSLAVIMLTYSVEYRNIEGTM